MAGDGEEGHWLRGLRSRSSRRAYTYGSAASSASACRRLSQPDSPGSAETEAGGSRGRAWGGDGSCGRGAARGMAGRRVLARPRGPPGTSAEAQGAEGRIGGGSLGGARTHKKTSDLSASSSHNVRMRRRKRSWRTASRRRCARTRHFWGTAMSQEEDDPEEEEEDEAVCWRHWRRARFVVRH